MTSELSVAILGAGSMGRKHAGNLAAQSGVRVVGFCATKQDSADAAAADFAGARGYTSFEQMLEETKAGALVVAIPPHAHNGEVEQAAERGMHLFLEKPLALDPGRAENMALAVGNAGVHCVVGYQMRFAEPVRKLKALLEDGSAGRPVLFQASYASNSLHTEWWRDKNKGGGQLLEQAIHLYDMGLHLCGMPVTVSCQMDNLVHQDLEDYTVDDVSASVLRYNSGALGAITANNSEVPWEWNALFKVVCKNLTVRVGADLNAEFIYTTDPENVRRETVPCGQDPYAEAARNFVETVRGEAQSLAPVQDGLAGVLTVHAAMRSALDGGTVQKLNL